MLKGEPRRILLIVIFVGLSVATLAFQSINIDFLGAQFQRLGTGPLGLRLGLDLQGGAPLVYQAIPTSEKETPTEEDMEGIGNLHSAAKLTVHAPVLLSSTLSKILLIKNLLNFDF